MVWSGAKDEGLKAVAGNLRRVSREGQTDKRRKPTCGSDPDYGLSGGVWELPSCTRICSDWWNTAGRWAWCCRWPPTCIKSVVLTFDLLWTEGVTMNKDFNLDLSPVSCLDLMPFTASRVMDAQNSHRMETKRNTWCWNLCAEMKLLSTFSHKKKWWQYAWLQKNTAFWKVLQDVVVTGESGCFVI